MTITTGSFSKDLQEGVRAWYGMKYNEKPMQYTDIYDVINSSRAFEEIVQMQGFGLAPIKTEGAGITYEDTAQGFIDRATHVTYGLAFTITREMYEDGMAATEALKRAGALAFSLRQTVETVCANRLNYAFSTTYTYGDGKELCATDHPNVTGGTWSNELTTAADISEAALEQALIDMGKWTNDRGLKIAIMPQKLIIPVDLQFDVERILMSPLQSGNSNNDINALKSSGKFPGGVMINHYLTDTDAWFIRTNCPEGLKYMERVGDTFSEDNDFDTNNLKYKARGRYSFGWTDPRGIYGSPGA